MRAISYIHATDVQRARAFYQDILGFEIVSADADVVSARYGGAPVRIITVEQHKPGPMTVFGFETDDIAAFVGDLKSRGVITERYNRDQDSQGVWTGPDGEKVAWFKDPDGNMLSVIQAD